MHLKYAFIGIAIIAVTILSVILLKKPLEEKNIEGMPSVLLRIFIGICGGIIVGFLIQM